MIRVVNLRIANFVQLGVRELCKSTSNNKHFTTPVNVVSAITARGVHTTPLANNRHFKVPGIPNAIKAATSDDFEVLKDKGEYDLAIGDHTGRQQNHIWSKEEINEVRETMYRHKPETMVDKATQFVMHSLYHTFNFFSSYREVNPTPKAIEWRLIVLESVAGVPGFVAAGFRHFRSLRTLQRDHGWILTLLEEAENERMHLLICLTMFKANLVTRALVVTAQVVMTPVLFLTYLICPQSMHRFVGYLEETAVHTYNNVITHIETPGTHLNEAWATLPAPQLAQGYYRLPEGATWTDTLKCMMADEAHHRDANHTYATLDQKDPNPFVFRQKEDAIKAWRMDNSGLNTPGIESVEKGSS